MCGYFKTCTYIAVSFAAFNWVNFPVKITVFCEYRLLFESMLFARFHLARNFKVLSSEFEVLPFICSL